MVSPGCKRYQLGREDMFLLSMRAQDLTAPKGVVRDGLLSHGSGRDLVHHRAGGQLDLLRARDGDPAVRSQCRHGTWMQRRQGLLGVGDGSTTSVSLSSTRGETPYPDTRQVVLRQRTRDEHRGRVRDGLLQWHLRAAAGWRPRGSLPLGPQPGTGCPGTGGGTAWWRRRPGPWRVSPGLLLRHSGRAHGPRAAGGRGLRALSARRKGWN